MRPEENETYSDVIETIVSIFVSVSLVCDISLLFQFQAITLSILFDTNVTRINETLFDKYSDGKNNTSTDLDMNSQRNEIDDFYYNKLNAPRTESVRIIIQGNYPNATEDERHSSEVCILKVQLTALNLNSFVPRNSLELSKYSN